MYFEALNANLTRNWAPLTGIVAGPLKLIDLPVPELYDLRADPGETQNLYARRPDDARRLEQMLEAFGRGAATPGRRGRQPRPPPGCVRSATSRHSPRPGGASSRPKTIRRTSCAARRRAGRGDEGFRTRRSHVGGRDAAGRHPATARPAAGV